VLPVKVAGRRFDMLEILDSIIATVTVVLVLSLIVQAIQQIIKQLWSFKSKYMERELLAMLQQRALPFVEKTWKDKLLERSPVSFQVKLLQRDKETEAIANLVSVLKGKLAAIGYNDLSLLETMKKDEVKNLLKVVSSELNGELKRAAEHVKVKIQEIKEAIEKAKDDVENWYDLTLKAFQDHYERRMKMWSYVLSLVVVVGLNANLFDIYKEFSSNRALRESAVALGEKLTSMPRDSVIIRQSEAKSDTIVVAVSAEQIKQGVKKNIADIKGMLEEESFQVMRWKSSTKFDLLQALGWLCMTLLVGLGAPFWYDFLKTVMGIKNTLSRKTEPVEEKVQDQGNRKQEVQQKKQRARTAARQKE
jgi:hypothetical protein